MKLILASESQGRRKLMEEAGFEFEAVSSNFVEDMTLPLAPHELTMHLSSGKARSVAEIHKDAVVIGADTVVVFGDKVLGKPHTKEKSIEMLGMLSGNVHSVITGLTVIDPQSGKEFVQSIETKIWFREILMSEIIEYTNSGESLNKAGAYALQLNGKKFLEKIEGCEYNVIGLPVNHLKEILSRLG